MLPREGHVPLPERSGRGEPLAAGPPRSHSSAPVLPAPWALLLALISVLRGLVWKLSCRFTFVRAPGEQSEEVNPRSSSSVEKGVCSPCPHVILSALRVHLTFRMITEFLVS